MDPTFLIASSLIFIALSGLIFFLVKSAKKHCNVEPINRKIMLIQRAAALIGIVFCILTAVFLIPRTPYGAYLVGNYYFSKYIQSGSEKSASRAFSLWQAGNSKAGFAEALDQMPRDSGAWKAFIKRSSVLYADEDKPEDYLEYLELLKRKLTDPVGKSAFYFIMGERYMDQLPENALGYFDTVVKLDVAPEDISMAKGNINEIKFLKIGQLAPDFSVRSIQGVEYSRDDFQGKIVLLDFWSMHCSGCLKEIPNIRKLYSRFASDDFILLTVSLESGKQVTDFISDQQLPGHHVLIERGEKAEILGQFNIQYIPATYVLDKEGRIAYKRLQGHKLEEAIESLVNRK